MGQQRRRRTTVGGRPAAILDLGWLKLRAALEYQYEFSRIRLRRTRTPSATGAAPARSQVVFAPYVEFGVNAGYAVIDDADAKQYGGEDAQKSGNRTSFGGFVNASPVPHILPNLLLGVGANYATFHDLYTDPATHDYDRTSNLQAFWRRSVSRPTGSSS